MINSDAPPPSFHSVGKKIMEGHGFLMSAYFELIQMAQEEMDRSKREDMYVQAGAIMAVDRSIYVTKQEVDKIAYGR